MVEMDHPGSTSFKVFRCAAPIVLHSRTRVILPMDGVRNGTLHLPAAGHVMNLTARIPSWRIGCLPSNGGVGEAIKRFLAKGIIPSFIPVVMNLRSRPRETRAARCVVGLSEHVTVNCCYEGRQVLRIASNVHFRWRTLHRSCAIHAGS